MISASLKEVIDNLGGQLDQLERQGVHQVEVAGLRKYLKAVEKSAAESQELRGRQYEGLLAQYAARNEQSIAMLEAVLEAGKSALHALLLTNGGAVVALLGVMSNLAGKPGTSGATLARYLALPLLEFGVAVLVCAVAFVARYCSQACYTEASDLEDEQSAKRYRVGGHAFRWLAVLSAIGSLVLFGFGIANAYNAVLWTFAR